MALESLNIKVDKYYSSEIDKYANKAANALYPATIQLGDIIKWREWDIDFSSIYLLLAGFPCQPWSLAGDQDGEEDPRGALVHSLIEIWNEIKKTNKNVVFMFENTRMSDEHIKYINNLFGQESIFINAALVSAQDRKRHYWTNLDVKQPGDIGIKLIDVLEELPDCNIGIKVREKSRCLRVGGISSPFGSNKIWNSPFQKVNLKGKLKNNIEK